MCNCTTTTTTTVCNTCNSCTTCNTCNSCNSTTTCNNCCSCIADGTTATPLDPCSTVEYCTTGCVEIIDDACVETRCGTLEQVIDVLFDEDCNAIPGCQEFGTAVAVNVCQNEQVNVLQLWLNSNPTLTNGLIHPVLTPEFVGSSTFTPTLADTYYFQFSQYAPCYKAQLITLTVTDCTGACPDVVRLGGGYNAATDLFELEVSNDFPTDSIYRIRVLLPDSTVVAELETNPGDITNTLNHIDNTNWNNFDQYLSTIDFNAANLNAGIAFTFNKRQWAIDNNRLYVSNGVTNATQLTMEISVEEPSCPVQTGTAIINRVVGAMLGSAYPLYDEGAGVLNYTLQTANTSTTPQFNTNTAIVTTIIPGSASVPVVTVGSPTNIQHTYAVTPFGTSPTTVNRYDMSLTTDLGHTSVAKGLEASGYDLSCFHSIDSYTLVEEGTTYTIGLRFRATLQEGHWDETTIGAKTHTNTIGGAPISAGLVLTNGGTSSASDTHILEAVETTNLLLGTHQLFSQFACDLIYNDGTSNVTTEETTFITSELELNYIF